MNAAARHPQFHSTLSSTRVCSYCELEVPRSEVHKDRRGRYSCRTCRDEGRHLKGWQRISYRLWTMRHQGNKLLMLYMLLATLGALALFGVLDFLLLG